MPHLITDSHNNWGWRGPSEVLWSNRLLRAGSAFRHPDGKHRQAHCRLTLNTSADTFCCWRESDGNESPAFFSLPSLWKKKSL